jgi:hypothetical protein
VSELRRYTGEVVRINTSAEERMIRMKLMKDRMGKKFLFLERVFLVSYLLMIWRLV